MSAATMALRAAIYARKSTAQTGVADEEKSVPRQITAATAYAARKGWMVLEGHVYQDDGISGAEFANRPGLVRLMNSTARDQLPQDPVELAKLANLLHYPSSDGLLTDYENATRQIRRRFDRIFDGA